MRTKKHRDSYQAFDPLLGVLVAESETASDRIRLKLTDPYGWCFCELCGRSTEYATAVGTWRVFKRLRKGNAKEIPLTDAIRKKAQAAADALVARYELALTGVFGSYEPVKMLYRHCDQREMRGDFSVSSFRDQVERRALVAAWVQHGDLPSVVRLPGLPEGAAKPSRLYREAHNPRRSEQARRAYQRDRRFAAEYDDLIAQIWRESAHKLPGWDVEAHAYVRREAYRLLLAQKTPTSSVEEFLDQGITNQAEIARQLGVSRQAVSAALKRRAAKQSVR